MMDSFLISATFWGAALNRVRHLLEGVTYSDPSVNVVAVIWDPAQVKENTVS